MDPDVIAILARLADVLEKQTEILKALARSGSVVVDAETKKAVEVKAS